MSQASDLRERAREIGAEYGSLIERLSRVSDDFIRMLNESGIEAARNLIESRSVLCTEFVRCGAALEPLVQELKRSDSGIGSDLQSLLDDINTNLASLNEKQKACEAALIARMDECRSELLALKKHDGLRHAYRGSQQVQNARFLDSMQ